MADISFRVESNRDEILRAEKDITNKILQAWGIMAQGYAQEYLRRQDAVDTGNLMNSISFGIDPEASEMQVGTNVTYGKYIEFGTGINASGGDGRKTPWRYQDSDGNWHTTRGFKARPFVRPALENHLDEYKDIMQEYLLGGST